MFELGLKGSVAPRTLIHLFELQQCRHQGLRDVPPAIESESPCRSGIAIASPSANQRNREYNSLLKTSATVAP